VTRPLTAADIISRSIAIEPHEAVALIRGVCAPASHNVAAAEHAEDVELRPDGTVAVSRSAARAGSSEVSEADSVGAMGRLLERLLRGTGDQAALPHRLRFVVMRATGHAFGQPDRPIKRDVFVPYQSSAEFLNALEGFPETGDQEHLRRLYRRAAERAPAVTRRMRIAPTIAVVVALVSVIALGYRAAVSDREKVRAGARPAPAVIAPPELARPEVAPSERPAPTSGETSGSQATNDSDRREAERLRARLRGIRETIADLEDERVRLDERLDAALTSDQEALLADEIDRIEARLDSLERTAARINARLAALR
jgi:hypothetical protein